MRTTRIVTRRKVVVNSATRDLAAALNRDHAIFVRWDCALGQVGDVTVAQLLAARADNDPSILFRGDQRHKPRLRANPIKIKIATRGETRQVWET